MPLRSRVAAPADRAFAGTWPVLGRGLRTVRLERRYRELKNRLQDLGFAIAGTVVERHTVCGADNCRCEADPPQRHGPYYQYSRKVAGKTTSRRLTAEQAEQYCWPGFDVSDPWLRPKVGREANDANARCGPVADRSY